MLKIILLAVLAAGTFTADQPELPIGFTFEAPTDVAEKLIAEGTARLATDDEPLSPSAPASSPAAGKNEKPAKAAKPVKVRLLCDGAYGKANDVVELPAGTAKQMSTDGQADSDPAAVAYALSLAQNQPEA